MSTTAGQLRQFLVSVHDERVYQNNVPEQPTPPYIWFAVRAMQTWDELEGQGSTPFREFYDVECVGATAAEANTLKEAVRSQLHNHPAGSFGGGTIAGAQVTDQVDSYIPQNQAADQGYSVAALDVSIYPGA